MALGEGGDPRQHLGPGRRGAARVRVDVEQQLLGRRELGLVARPQQAVEQQQALCVVPEQLRLDQHLLAGPRLVQEREVRLDREVAAARRQVRGVDADVAQQGVRGVAEQLQVAALVRVAVVVDPLRADAVAVQAQRRAVVDRRRAPAPRSKRSRS